MDTGHYYAYTRLGADKVCIHNHSPNRFKYHADCVVVGSDG
jgi:hypothetical protein